MALFILVLTMACPEVLGSAHGKHCRSKSCREFRQSLSVLLDNVLHAATDLYGAWESDGNVDEVVVAMQHLVGAWLVLMAIVLWAAYTIAAVIAVIGICMAWRYCSNHGGFRWGPMWGNQHHHAY
jgi:hypothetical protein